MATKIGDIVGDYKVIGFVGSGGMGTVYQIEHAITKRVEAMKVLPTGVSSNLEDVRRFEREIEVQARLNHPNIVALHTALRDQDSIALIMEYVHGESLERKLENGRLPVDTAISYAAQVLNALAYAHDNGVIHRDVKPANIIIDSLGVAKLSDFGLALSVKDIRLTSAGSPVGSAWYMSPEQVRGAHDLDARSDIYGMGAVLHEMLTGRKLFDGDGPFDVMRAQIEEIPKRPTALNPELPAAIDGVIAQAVAKDPRARFQNANEFRNALEAGLSTLHYAAASERRHVLRIDNEADRRSNRFILSRVTTPRALALATVVTIGAGVWVVPLKLPHMGAGSLPPQAHTMPARRAEQQSSNVPASEDATAAVHSSQVSREAAASPSSAAPSTSSRQAVERASTGRALARAAKPPAPTSVSKPSPPDDTVSEAAEQAKPQKSGNRFVRALGKLNPFRSRAKKDPISAEKAASSETIER